MESRNSSIGYQRVTATKWANYLEISQFWPANKKLGLSENGVEIAVSYDEFDVKIRGRHLHRLWRELRAFRVKEVSLNGGAAVTSLGGAAERCFVESIAFLEVATET